VLADDGFRERARIAMSSKITQGHRDLSIAAIHGVQVAIGSGRGA
jgi:hypothetical protein